MTGRSRRQARQQVADHQRANPPAPKPVNNRVWEQLGENMLPFHPEGKATTPVAVHPDSRPLSVEFAALRLLEAMVRKEGRAALCAGAALDCADTARTLLKAARR